MKFFIALFVFIVSISSLINNRPVYAQSNKIFIPNQIKKLYDGKTRSWDGKPGDKYWINRADYNINIKLNPDSAVIEGNETIKYFNNSPFDLDKLVIQLFNNLYRKGSERDFEIAEEDLTDGVKIKKLIVGEKEITIEEEVQFTSTNMIISNLPGGFIPHNDSVKLYFEWETQLPKISFMRTGKYDDGVIFAAYFYPKIAVYDDVYGWDKLEYTGEQEFYSDFGNYEVKITLPEKYMVWATGLLQNAGELFSENIYKKYINALSSDKVIKIISAEDLAAGNYLLNKNENNTWYYKAENIPDFSFGCSNKFLWDGVSAVVDKSTGRRSFVDAAYPDSAKYFDEAAQLSKYAIEYLSNELPGYPYPYPKFTSFDNTQKWGGGMEFPMMANDGEYNDKAGFVTLLIHEMGHTYFPFFTGTNERRYSWMDEGWASFFPTEFAPKYIEGYSHYNWYKNFYKNWGILGSENDLPLMVSSHSLRGPSLTILSYARSFFAIHSLKNLLGEQLFKTCLIEFIERWKGKHPLPYDFFFTFNDVSGEDLSWFWKPWFYDFANCDLAIESSINDEANTVIKILKIGAQPVPVKVKLVYNDETVETIVKNIRIWQSEKNEFEINTDKNKILKSAEIITDQIPDVDSSNNYIEF